MVTLLSCGLDGRNPTISSLTNATCRQWPLTVPVPQLGETKGASPQFSTGTMLPPEYVPPPIVSNWACAFGQLKYVSLMVPGGFDGRDRHDPHSVPKPRTCPISCSMTLFSAPAEIRPPMSALSKSMYPTAVSPSERPTHGPASRSEERRVGKECSIPRSSDDRKDKCNKISYKPFF